MWPLTRSDEDKRRKIDALYEKSRRFFLHVPEIRPEELLALPPDHAVVVVDVRTPEEQAVSMIPGAVTAPEFERRKQEYRGAAVVTYCTVGHRAGLYAQDLCADGWNAMTMKGSVLAWTHAGGPLEDIHGPTRRVHVASRRLNLVAGGYEPVW